MYQMIPSREKLIKESWNPIVPEAHQDTPKIDILRCYLLLIIISMKKKDLTLLFLTIFLIKEYNNLIGPETRLATPNQNLQFQMLYSLDEQ